MSHDYSHESTREDSRMMAFFDSLVQREIQDWSSDNVSANPLSSSDSEIQSPERPNVSDSDNGTFEKLKKKEQHFDKNLTKKYFS